jgi:pimeloyl-ACP methyl ester carboxylesterase
MKTLLRAPKTTSALLALVLSFSSGSLAARAAATPDNAGPNPVVSTVGTLRVERYGAGSPAIVFVPGLACGSWVWSGAVTRFAAKHAVYVVTLAGFDGLPAPAAPTLDEADASLLSLVTKEKLERPIIVGHSLGGFLSLRFGTEHSNLVRGIVSVDGTPVFPTLAQATPDERAKAGKEFAALIQGQTPEQFQAGQAKFMTTMVTADADAAKVAAYTAKSDRNTVAAYAEELYAADLRPQLPKLTAPTLELAPVPTTPAPYEGPNAATASMADRETGYHAFYASLFPGAPNLTIEMVPNSKHFIMVDQPKAFYDDLAAFVAKVS